MKTAKRGRFSAVGSMEALPPDQQRNVRISQEVVNVAKEIGVTASQVALAWFRHNDASMIPIIGTRKLAQLKDNLDSLNVQISVEQMNRLNEVSKIQPIFPNNFFNRSFVPKFVYGDLRDKIDA